MVNFISHLLWSDCKKCWSCFNQDLSQKYVFDKKLLWDQQSSEGGNLNRRAKIKYTLSSLDNFSNVFFFQFQVELPILSNAECTNLILAGGFENEIRPFEVCAGFASGQKDTCGVNKIIF